MNSEIGQFCVLAKAQRGLACAHLIVKVIGHKNIFSFGELLDIPSIAALQQSEYAVHVNTLELFAFGVYLDYENNRSQYLPLTDANVTKLKQLTLVSLASQSQNKSLSYDEMMAALSIDIDRHSVLEDIIVQCIYLGLFKGKLNQKSRVFRVSECSSRDVRREDIPGLIAKLKAWRDATNAVQGRLVDDASTMQQALKDARDEQSMLNAEIANVAQSLKFTKDSNGFQAGRRGNSGFEGETLVKHL